MRESNQLQGSAIPAKLGILARNWFLSLQYDTDSMNTADCYDSLAGVYDLIFEDWESSIERQASVLSALLLNCGLTSASRILDCACGIGTQSLGLARRGFNIIGSDISPKAVERARQEASRQGLDIEFRVADMIDLTSFDGMLFDAVICMDNSIPHLTTDQDLFRAAMQIQARLRPGGVFIASIRDYDAVLAEHPVVQGPSFYGNEGNRRIVFQLWDWIDESRYVFHLYLTRQVGQAWNTFHTQAMYRGLRRAEFDATLTKAEFTQINWRLPPETGFYQPLVVAKKPISRK